MTASIATPPKLQFFDANGAVLVGGKIYTYAGGTTTPIATYTSSTALIANTNPIILDSAGQANIWLLPTVSYKFVVKTSADVSLYTTDNIYGYANATSVEILLASPPAIGNVTPNSGAFTTLSASDAATVKSLTSTASPSIAYSFAGVPGLNNILVSTTAASTTNAEIGLVVGMSNSVSGTSKLDTYKMGIASFVDMSTSNAAFGWASNFACQAAAGVGNVSCIGTEIDLNIFNQAYNQLTGPAYAANLYLTGTSTSGNYANAAIMMAYGGTVAYRGALYNYGILSVDYAPATAYNTAFISDQSASPTIFHATNSHTKGIDFSAATFSGNSLSLPNFTVASTGKTEVYASAVSLQIESVVRNDTSGAGVAAIGFNVSSSLASETTSTKAGIGLVRSNPYGGGSLCFYNNNSAAAGDFTTADLRMSIDYSGSLVLEGSVAQKLTGTTWVNPSDQRLKNNIRDYTKGISELMQVRVREWEFNGKGRTTEGHKGLGVVADEVMSVLPDTISDYEVLFNDDDTQTTAIKKFDATEITWLLVKAVQEQQTVIADLTTRIAALESK